jgi:hypothetical protein
MATDAQQCKQPMNPRHRAFAGSAALCAAMSAFAFVAAPKSCEWGNNAYFWVGVACLMTLLALPWILRGGRSAVAAAGMGIGFVAVGIVVWLAGALAANMRIICALF